MPAVDTEVLFALDPGDKKHKRAIGLLTSRQDLFVPDTATFEFQMVMRARGRRAFEIKEIAQSIHAILLERGVPEMRTMDSALIAQRCSLESDYKLTFFDSLVAASALSLDSTIVSDDAAFDLVPGLSRIPLT